jgi:hypothetical protein
VSGCFNPCYPSNRLDYCPVEPETWPLRESLCWFSAQHTHQYNVDYPLTRFGIPSPYPQHALHVSTVCYNSARSRVFALCYVAASINPLLLLYPVRYTLRRWW